MNTSKILYYYKLISKNQKISEEILSSLSDLDNRLCEDNQEIDINEPFFASEIKKLELPPDFVEAVYALSEKEFWDCYRCNTFKPFQRMSILKEYPNIKCQMPRLLHTHKGVNYQNFIYNNRDHLLYLTRMDLLQNIDFAITDEALHLIENYQDILKILEEEDQEKEDQEKEHQEKERREEERYARRCYHLSRGMKY